MTSSFGDASTGVDRLRAAGALVEDGARAWLGPDVRIGRDVSIGAGATVVADRLELGDEVRIRTGVDLRAGSIKLGGRTEVLPGVRALVADELEVGVAGRIESGVQITCRSFRAGRLFYLAHESSVGYGGTTASTAILTAGDRVAIGPCSILNANRPIVLEDQVGSGAYLSIWTHGYHFGHRLLDGYPASFSPVHVESNVWLGYHVTLLPGVRVGRNTIVAAGAVVASDLPANILAGGVPATAKRKLTPQPPEGEAATECIRRLLDGWHDELVWKKVPVAVTDDGLMVDGSHHVVLIEAGAGPPPLLGEERQLLLTIDDRPDLRIDGASYLLFELRSGRLYGELDLIGHDLRDFLRRNALPCGDEHTFISLPAAPFERLVKVGR
jgi:acetyltransferase-like isoleucine patch superfamily enzyme